MLALLRQGYTDVVDADLSKYFDTIPHDELMQSLARRIVDLDLLRLYCNKVMRMEGGVASPVTDIRKLDELLAA